MLMNSSGSRDLFLDILVMKPSGGETQSTIEFPERKLMRTQFPPIRVFFSSTSSHGTSNSAPLKDSFSPLTLETDKSCNSRGTLFTMGTLRPICRVCNAKKVWRPKNQRKT